jgi:hypothetical protein
MAPDALAVSGRVVVPSLADIQQRGLALAEKRVVDLQSHMVREMGASFPDLVAAVDGQDVVIEGRDLLHLWLSDARLRNVAELAKGGG